MSEQVHTEQIARAPKDEKPQPLAAPITIINDSGATVSAMVGHWWWGLVTVAYVGPGQQLALPCGSGANDVFVLSQVTAHVVAEVTDVACVYKVTYHKKKVVDAGGTVKVSQF